MGHSPRFLILPLILFYCIAAFTSHRGRLGRALHLTHNSMDYQKLTDQELHYEARFAKQQIDNLIKEVERIANLLYGQPDAPPVLTCVPSWITLAIHDHMITLEQINLECARRYMP